MHSNSYQIKMIKQPLIVPLTTCGPNTINFFTSLDIFTQTINKLRLEYLLHYNYNMISYRYGFTTGFTKEIPVFHIQTINDSVTYDLFNKAKASNHCLYHLLPPQRPLHEHSESEDMSFN